MKTMENNNNTNPLHHTNTIGDSEQWDRVAAASQGGDRDRRRAEAAHRNARMFGTDPSWYGF